MRKNTSIPLLHKRLKTEIKNNLYLSEKEKKFWIDQGPDLPEKMVRFFVDLLTKENRIAERNIKNAIRKNPWLVIEIKEKSKTMKMKLNGLQESEDRSGVEDDLEENLKQI